MTEGICRSVYRVGLGNDDDKVLRTNSSTSSDDVRRRYKVRAMGHTGAHPSLVVCPLRCAQWS